jgi:transposase-like protein
MLEAREDVLAFCHFPGGHWKKIWSTNLLERVNEEIKCRIRVVGIFPNDAVIPVLEKLPAQRPGTGNRNSVIQIQA